MHLVKALWRGEVPLARTYWVFGVGVNMLLSFALISLRYNELRLLWVPGFALIFRGIWLFAVVYGFFMIGAVWRSASNYKGSGVYAVLAKTAAVLGAITLVRAVVGAVVPTGVNEYSLREDAAAANRQLPVVLNDEIRFDGVRADGMRLTYRYTVTNLPASDINNAIFGNAAFGPLRSQTCEQQRRYLDAGVTLVFSYYGNDGVAGPVLTVNRESCAQ